MSAPVTERGRTAVRGRTAAIPAQRGFTGGAADGAAAAPVVPVLDPGVGAERRSAQQKAYARRDERVRRVTGARPARGAAPAGRPQFVLLIMVLLAAGLVATLWLSTAAAADSYQLQDATAEARVLSEQAERLKQEVAVLASAPELARRAGELGMVPVRDPARLVVAVDGNVDVVGQPRAAVPPPPPAPPAPPAGAQPPAEGGTDGSTPEGAVPGAAVPDGTAQLAAPDTEEAGAAAVDGDDASAEDAGQGESAQRESAQRESAQRESAQRESTGESTQGSQARSTQAQGAAPGTAARAGGGRTDAG
ncbi:hypothetical protein [Pseudonocardia cypriaca]|uniref:Cell division protein FtsL n=1 Tax=Pseudonocardia cypriaca TaxID=882449 RepID=A0A543GEY6_9PSEU|nr:hypothetical protein [Pseudonocardia cypriaca]TQM44624.1 cell division protein FtsL [Pseudonocardia cypriaca]